MNLLDATAQLIDTAKTYALENDKVVQRAIKRMEKRLQVLRLRAAKARRRNRHYAWWDVMWTYVGGFEKGTNRAVVDCPGCKVWIDFGDFTRAAEISGSGKIKGWLCTQCGFDLAKGIKRHPDRPFKR